MAGTDLQQLVIDQAQQIVHLTKRDEKNQQLLSQLKQQVLDLEQKFITQQKQNSGYQNNGLAEPATYEPLYQRQVTFELPKDSDIQEAKAATLGTQPIQNKNTQQQQEITNDSIDLNPSPLLNSQNLKQHNLKGQPIAENLQQEEQYNKPSPGNFFQDWNYMTKNAMDSPIGYAQEQDLNKSRTQDWDQNYDQNQTQHLNNTFNLGQKKKNIFTRTLNPKGFFSLEQQGHKNQQQEYNNLKHLNNRGLQAEPQIQNTRGFKEETYNLKDAKNQQHNNGIQGTDQYQQYYIRVRNERQKVGALFNHLAEIMTRQKVIIFVNNSQKVDKLTFDLRLQKISAWGYHSKTDPRFRDIVLKEFSKYKNGALITENLPKGLDSNYWQDVCVVANMDLPITQQEYFSRVDFSKSINGRVSLVTFLHKDEEYLLQNITRNTNTVIQEMPRQVEV